MHYSEVHATHAVIWVANREVASDAYKGSVYLKNSLSNRRESIRLKAWAEAALLVA